jgi:G-patch domain
MQNQKKQIEAPLVIPPLQNRDWREIAKKRKNAARFVPASAPNGFDGSVGGLGTRDTIGAGAVRGGLHLMTKVEKAGVDGAKIVQEANGFKEADPRPEPETEDQRAIRAILASATGEATPLDGPSIDIIPMTSATVTEADAFQQDVRDLPDVATLDDYARVPVSQFGAALLRGMGWKEGTAASLTRSGPVEPYLPEARPALLGIGAKPREENVGAKRPEKRYVPVVKMEKGKGKDGGRDMRDGSGMSSRAESRHGSASTSRRTSRSPPRRDRDRESDRNGGRRERDRGFDESERDRDRRRYDQGYEKDGERGYRRRGDR